MIFKWLPWTFIVRRAFRSRGFLDPLSVLARLRAFAQPSEVGEPIELIRAGMVFHARGLINSRAIQHNMDWVWPYWVERQFDPEDASFVPRAFSLTHINLTHRNWTAVGLPDCPELPIVDPRGLATPFFDGWSLDCWVLADDGRALLPSREAEAEQTFVMGDPPEVDTIVRHGNLSVRFRAYAVRRDDRAVCRLHWKAEADAPARMAIVLRPYNPEGISFIQEARALPEGDGWLVDKGRSVRFDTAPDSWSRSTYRQGDVYERLSGELPSDGGTAETCDVGMLTAAAVFRLEPGRAREVSAEIALLEKKRLPPESWGQALSGRCELRIPDQRFQFLYEAALRTLVLHSSEEVYPGPYTYKRFWFRDAAFILNALLCAGLQGRVERALDKFPHRQTARGYFRSQEGEWDSNGQALWIMERFCRLSGNTPKDSWRRAILRGGRWIGRKRIPPGGAHAGLLPAGFSAEHLGLNDFYYWDDFWGAAGLRAASRLCEALGEARAAREFDAESADLLVCIARSLDSDSRRLGHRAMPAAPGRRMDSGAIGSLVAGYPLGLWPADDPRLLATAEHLMRENFVHGAFFQEMIHSGLNPYLTLHVAQILLAARDFRFLGLMEAVAGIASSTGQWPEAVHPRTQGGCMGDGQHVWAAAEWVMMLRGCFVLEDEDSGRLILGSGVPPAWLASGQAISFGPTPTPYGDVSIRVEAASGGAHVSWKGRWRGAEPAIQAALPGFAPATAKPGEDSVRV